MRLPKIILSLMCSLLTSAAFAQSLVEDNRLRPASMRCSGNKEYKVHLTFDDGPSIPETLKVLDILKKHGIKATFFISASRFANMASGKPPTRRERALLSVIERMKAEGHTIGNHSFEHIDHADINRNQRSQIEKNLQSSYRVMDILKIDKPTPFRFPYGSGWLSSRDPAKQSMANIAMENVQSNGYIPMHWDLDTEDWSMIKRKALPHSLLSGICRSGGGIALMHDIHKWTADNLEVLIESISQSGHEMVSNADILKYSSNRAAGTFPSLRGGNRPSTDQNSSGGDATLRGVY